MQGLAEDMDEEWEAYHDLLQDPDNFRAGAKEEDHDAGGPRGRTAHIAAHIHTGPVTGLAVLVLAADRLAAEYRGSDEYRMTS